MTKIQEPSGGIYELPWLDVAVDQLDTAIRLLLDQKAYVPAYTLAGAAEELIGKRVSAPGEPNALLLMKSKLPNHDFNELRNFLKHGNKNGEAVDMILVSDLPMEVAVMICRAFHNLDQHDGSVCSEGSRFRAWLNMTYPEMIDGCDIAQGTPSHVSLR